MAGTGIKEFIVNGTAYKYTELAPIEGLKFGTRCAKIVGPLLASLFQDAPKNATEGPQGDFSALLERVSPALQNVDDAAFEGLLMECFGHVYTPTNENLGDLASFNAWFTERKADIFPVGVIALVHLAKDFFPKVPGTIQAA